MDPHPTHPLTRVVNAAGTYTPLGVSRSSPHVAAAVAAALQNFYDIDELQRLLNDTVTADCAAEAATVVHCAAAGITLCVAAAMTGADADKAAALPDTTGLRNRIVIPAGHAVDYGHPIVTDIRLAGAVPVLAGDARGCSIRQLQDALDADRTAALLLVSSRLVQGAALDLGAAVAVARSHNLPTIIDGAAQDLRIDFLLATGADVVVLSAHKYLAAPTAGLLIGKRSFIDAVRAQSRGIGRAFKPSKEALLGVVAAWQERRGIDIAVWRQARQHKVDAMVDALAAVPGLRASAEADPAGGPFSRVVLNLAAGQAAATALVAALRSGTPSVRVMEHRLRQGELLLELVPLDATECRLIAERVRKASASGAGSTPF
ncbi:MAG: aminotransferase class V-fold PLP-dependent enzyme [Rubrivivax sp.]